MLTLRTAKDAVKLPVYVAIVMMTVSQKQKKTRRTERRFSDKLAPFLKKKEQMK